MTYIVSLGRTAWLSEAKGNMKMNTRTKLITNALVLALGMAAERPAAGETIYSTFGPANSFDGTRETPVNFYTSPEIIGTSLAFAFDVPATSDYQFAGISIAASWDGTKKNALFALFSTTAGLPASVPLEVLATNPDSLQPVWPSVIWLSSASHPILGAGQRYWLVCQPDSLDASVPANDLVELWMNSQGHEGLRTSRTSYNSSPWGDWFAPAFVGQSPAFSVEATAVPECNGAFGGCDNFSGNSIDASRWSGPVVFSGAGFLTETNQRLEFTSTGGSGDICFLRWALNPGSYTQDWELKVDVKKGMPVVTASPQPNVHLNLLVSPSTNISPNDIFSIEFGKENRGYLHCEVASSSGRVVLADTNTTATNLSLRIAFDSAQKRLSAYVDEDGADCGYSWKPMGSTVVPAGWGMTSNEFSAVLLGIAHFVAVAPTNNVFFDNFHAASCPIPRLEIAHQGNGVAMVWPTNAPDFRLESTTSLFAPTCWSVVTNLVTTVGSNFTVIDLISSQTKFFRMSRIYGCE